jgi:hypothetical protein
VRQFDGGLAYVEKDGKSGFIDTSGKIVVALEYDYIETNDSILGFCYFPGGYAWVMKDGKRGLIDKTGRFVVPLEYDYDCDVAGDDLVWFMKDGKIGLLQILPHA